MEAYTQWRNAKAGVIDCPALAADLTGDQRKLTRDGWRWYVCPCGGDHYAARRHYPDGLSQTLSAVLTCFVTRQQWLVKAPDVEQIIRSEEVAYLASLAKHEAIVKKVVKSLGVSDETIAFLWDTHGITKEEVEEILACD